MAHESRVPQTNESAQTKRALLESATRLFSERGYSHTTILDITDAVGLAKGALYHHFASKEDILVHIQDDMVERIMDESRTVLEGDPSPTAALAGLIRVHARMAATHRAAILVILRERKVFGAENWQTIRRQRAEVEAMFTRVIEQGQQTGDFALVAEPRLVTLAIIGMINWSSEWYRARSDDPDEIAEVFIDLTLPGLVYGPVVDDDWLASRDVRP